MTLIKIENDKVVMTEEEKLMFYKLVKRHLELMPNVYRKRHSNWVVVQHLTYHGSTYSGLICEYLGVNPSGYDWSDTNE